MADRFDEFSPDSPFASGSTILEPEDYFAKNGTQFVPSSGKEAIEASMTLSWNDAPTVTIARGIADQFGRYQNRHLPRFSAEELNQKFPEMEKPFTSPMSLPDAMVLADRAKDRKRLEQVAANWQAGATGAVAKFVAGVVPQMFDPLNYASGRAIGGVMKAQNLMQGSGLGAGIAREFTENVIGNVALEPVNYLQAHQEQRQYTAEDAAASVVYGALAGTAMHGAIAGGGKALNMLFKGSPEFSRTVEQAAEAAAQSGKRADDAVAPIVHDRMNEVTGVGAEPYTPLDLSEAAGPSVTRPFFASSPRTMDPEVQFHTLDEELFEGAVQLSDNANVAHGHAASKHAEVEGTVFEYDLSGTKLLDLEQPLPAEVRPMLEAIVHHKYSFEPMDTSLPTEGRVFYHGTQGDFARLSDADVYAHSNVKNLFGEGLYLTDNPNIARGYSKTRGKGAQGKVLAAKLKNLNLVDLEKPLPDGAWKVYSKYLHQYMDADQVSALRGKRGTRVFDDLKEAMRDSEIYESEAIEIYGEINRELSDAGFDGLRHQGGDRTGNDPHNVAILFENKYVNTKTNQIEGRLLKDKFEDTDYTPPAVEGNLREVFASLSPEQRAEVKSALQAAGYDGVRHEGGLGSGNKHNVISFFPESSGKLTEKNRMIAERTRVPTLDDAEIRKAGEHMLSHKSDLLHDEDAEIELDRMFTEQTEEPEVIGEMQKQALEAVKDTPHAEALETAFKEHKAHETLQVKMATLLKHCFMKGGA